MAKTDLYIFDTNTLISAFLISGSVAFFALEKAIANGTLVFSTETFAEFEQVLFRKKFDKYFSEQERIQIIERLAHVSIFIKPLSNGSYCRDPDDDKLLNLAIDISAYCIVSGDNDLLVLHPFKNIPIIKASVFRDLFADDIKQ
ncbi:putative PIN family toxin of toxin-antitoxin system [Mucilaginibacter gracilis]|uniref:Putative PIN family toxin of toxin-antitoxin system n=1 Tax=Mucilaginibacter gracilis TaxID=423350 RepID=A0A495IZB3_9SPHI|nr:putative toxin-antitoxin system toxin component, PIN family [Mucilaginibacter gracilis]RKR81354.1 putative PIN family toxin of toxin-antitoxin system [Mucilaginibacter gracilis]